MPHLHPILRVPGRLQVAKNVIFPCKKGKRNTSDSNAVTSIMTDIILWYLNAHGQGRFQSRSVRTGIRCEHFHVMSFCGEYHVLSGES